MRNEAIQYESNKIIYLLYYDRGVVINAAGALRDLFILIYFSNYNEKRNCFVLFSF